MSDLNDFRDDGLSASRRDEFAAASRSVREWEERHPRDFESYLRFLESFQEVFGELAPTFDGSVVGRLRL
jgi:hypothetical protein